MLSDNAKFKTRYPSSLTFDCNCAVGQYKFQNVLFGFDINFSQF